MNSNALNDVLRVEILESIQRGLLLRIHAICDERVPMLNRKEFSQLRRSLGKTQMQMAVLLGISVKGIQSFEQGWREIPAAVERDLLFLLGANKAVAARTRPCWSVKKCSQDIRAKCPVWEFQAGNICWLFNVTLCQGHAPKTWNDKVKRCRKCEVYQSAFDLPRRGRNHTWKRNDRVVQEHPLKSQTVNL